jgi:hypothetical protein
MVEGIACAKKLVAYRAHDEARKELRNCAENALFINQSLKDGDGNNDAMLFN